MDKGQVIARAEQYVNLVQRMMCVRSAYLFGSYASGTPREDSDIDIGIITDTMPTDYLAALKSLYKTRRGVDSRIEPHLFISGLDDSGFQSEVVEHGIRLL